MKKQGFLGLNKHVLEYAHKQHEFNEATKNLIGLFLPLVTEAIREVQKTLPPASAKRGVTRKQIIDRMDARVQDAYARYAKFAPSGKRLPYLPNHPKAGSIVLAVDKVCGKEHSLYNRAINCAYACELIQVIGKSARCFVVSEKKD